MQSRRPGSTPSGMEEEQTNAARDIAVTPPSPGCARLNHDSSSRAISHEGTVQPCSRDRVESSSGRENEQMPRDDVRWSRIRRSTRQCSPDSRYAIPDPSKQLHGKRWAWKWFVRNQIRLQRPVFLPAEQSDAISQGPVVPVLKIPVVPLRLATPTRIPDQQSFSKKLLATSWRLERLLGSLDYLVHIPVALSLVFHFRIRSSFGDLDKSPTLTTRHHMSIHSQFGKYQIAEIFTGKSCKIPMFVFMHPLHIVIMIPVVN